MPRAAPTAPRLARRAALIAWLGVSATAALAAETITFDVSAFEKRPFEWSGYVEARPEGQRLDRGSALYALQFPDGARRDLTRTAVAAEASGVYRHGELRGHFTARAAHLDDPRGDSTELAFYEAYGAWQPATGLAAEAGKRTLRWGKGYAFSPVAFFERARDPTDPELAREGFTLVAASAVRSFDGPLSTLGLTALVTPTHRGLNGGLGDEGHWNPGARLSALACDTDVDLLFAGRGSRGARVGLDFSRNLGPQVAVHGEWARARAAQRLVLTPSLALVEEVRSGTSYLVGVRYLGASNTTLIAEYYRNGNGYTREEAARFATLARLAATDARLRPAAARAAAAFAAPNPMREYVYLRVSRPEPFDILYLTPAITAIVNADDRSYTLIPELTWTRFRNLELRLRAQVNRGGRDTDFGGKPAEARVEFRLRYFF